MNIEVLFKTLLCTIGSVKMYKDHFILYFTWHSNCFVALVLVETEGDLKKVNKLDFFEMVLIIFITTCIFGIVQAKETKTFSKMLSKECGKKKGPDKSIEISSENKLHDSGIEN